MSERDEGLDSPLVSIIITTYNYKQYIEKAINSALAQDVSKEIIVIDDCSTDETEEYLRMRYSTTLIRYVKNPVNLGVASSRNKGVLLAKGKYIAFLDADDRWKSDKLKKQLELLEKENGVLSFTGRLLENQLGQVRGILHVDPLVKYRGLLYYNQITCSSVVLLRKVALEFPMEYDEFHEDYLNWLKILRKHKCAYGIDEPLVIYHMSDGGKSRNKLKSMAMTYNTHRCMGRMRIVSLWYTMCHLINASLNLLSHKGEINGKN